MRVHWPVLDGWGHETIPFPLPFAPSLPYRGTEEVRFMPGWARAGQPDHWSYAFAWWLESFPRPDEASLAADLTAYYGGLCAAVGGESTAFDPNGYRVELRVLDGDVRAGHEVRRLDGTADLVDAFGDGQRFTLNLRLEMWDCSFANRVVVLIEACPTLDEAIWERLRAQALQFACH